MKNKILIGNISAETTEELLRELLAGTAGVVSVSVPLDPKSQKNRGYAFVEMAGDLQAEKAAANLHGTELDGRAITCSVVEPPGKPKWYELKAQHFRTRRGGH
jgi:RNA recognition motif-containing protein